VIIFTAQGGGSVAFFMPWKPFGKTSTGRSKWQMQLINEYTSGKDISGNLPETALFQSANDVAFGIPSDAASYPIDSAYPSDRNDGYTNRSP